MMHAFVTSVLLLLAARVTDAYVYITNPIQATMCNGGDACQVQWVDNGVAPLLSAIGECQVGLYAGDMLVQSLPSVDVATTSSFEFTPNPAAGASGHYYYLVFTSSNINYQSFSGSFTLTGMTGAPPSGSSIPASTPASTPAGSSTSAGSSVSVSATTPTDTATTPSGSSTPSVSGTLPTSTGSATPSDTATGTIPSTTPAPSSTLSTPTSSTSSTSTFVPSSVSTSTVILTTTRSAASASPSATNAATRVGTSVSSGAVAALLALVGAFAF